MKKMIIFLRICYNIAKVSILHPFTTSYINKGTGEIINER